LLIQTAAPPSKSSASEGGSSNAGGESLKLNKELDKLKTEYAKLQVSMQGKIEELEKVRAKEGIERKYMAPNRRPPKDIFLAHTSEFRASGPK
jgi:hypothetical protein